MVEPIKGSWGIWCGLCEETIITRAYTAKKAVKVFKRAGWVEVSEEIWRCPKCAKKSQEEN